MRDVMAWDVPFTAGGLCFFVFRSRCSAFLVPLCTSSVHTAVHAGQPG